MEEELFTSVPVVEVTTDNVSWLEPTIRAAIKGATFVAVDCVRFTLLLVWKKTNF